MDFAGCTPRDAQEAAEDINVRETKAGIRTIMKVMEDLMEPTALIFRTDNVTARAALISGFYPGNEQLTNELQAGSGVSDGVFKCPLDLRGGHGSAIDSGGPTGGLESARLGTRGEISKANISHV